ncbi:MAG: hemin uptake protein HemP [Planctomycetia bacterium]|nr:hemin uptake protein HemP [Planctomycetia bacterium]
MKTDPSRVSPDSPSADSGGHSEQVVSGEASPRVICSETLFQGGRRVMIRHGDQVYCLLCTRNNKLILTK